MNEVAVWAHTQSLKDLNPAKLPSHSSTDAFVYATYLYTNAINSVCYVTTRDSLSLKSLQVNVSPTFFMFLAKECVETAVSLNQT